MDYWEFTQFLSIIGLPRLREVQAIITSFSKPSNHITTALSNTEQLISNITTSSRKLTFFENGTLPVQLLHLNPTVRDNLATCDCLIKQEKKDGAKNIQPFSVLYDRLPQEFQQLILDKDHEDISRQRMHAQLILRLFELVAISTVLGEVLQCVSE